MAAARQADACISARERAYAAHLEAGDRRRAAMVALSLVRDHGNRLAAAQSSSWFKRAERLLQDEPEYVEHGYLEMMRARDAHSSGRFDEAGETGERAVQVGTRFGDRNLQALSLVYKGMATVARGEVEEGPALLY